MREAPPLPESRPSPLWCDYIKHPGRSVPRRGNRGWLAPVGEFCPPDVCLHPVEARVWADRPGYVAKCHDCGWSTLRNGTWEIAR